VGAVKEELMEVVQVPAIEVSHNLINLDTAGDGVCTIEAVERVKEDVTPSQMGRLVWEKFSEIGAPNWIIQGTKYGFQMPVVESKVEWPKRGNKVILEEEIDFVNKEWRKLQEIGVLEEGYVKMISRMRCAPKKGPRKFRLVVVMCGLNKGVTLEKVKFEGLPVLKRIMRKGWWQFGTDFADGYHHVVLHPSLREWMGVEWQGEVLRFTRLPFGVSFAPGLFTKIVRACLQPLRTMGYMGTPWIDDIWWTGSNKEELEIFRDKVYVPLLEGMGWKFNWEKSQKEVVHVGDFLGLQVDLNQGALCIPPEKKKCYQRLLKETLGMVTKEGVVMVRALSVLLGKLVSVKEAWQEVRPFTRSGYRTLMKRSKWNLPWTAKVEPDNQLIEDLVWLAERILIHNGKLVCLPAVVEEVATDASDTGWGAIWRGREMRGGWDSEDASLSINRRELLGFWYALACIKEEVRGRFLRWLGDNTSAVAWLWNGSRDPEVGRIVKQVWQLASNAGISFVLPKWVKSGDMPADALSRIVDYGDWTVSWEVFKEVEALWGTHTIDRFADHQNSKCKRFNSRWWVPGTETVDAFTVEWKGENNWCVPPLELVPQTLKHAWETGGNASIVIPVWRTSWWWPWVVIWTSAFHPLKQNDIVFQPGPSGFVEPLRNKSWVFWVVRMKERS
jgi:hypothetical protein